MAQERIQKILSRAGISSRRKAEELIRLGEVTINGRIAKLGDKGEFGKDAIKVSGKLIHSQEEPAYYAFYKPQKVVSSLADPQGRPTIADYIAKLGKRVFPIGRLDFMSEGLILLTNDGDFLQQVQTRKDVLRVYRVKVADHPKPDQLARLERGGRFKVEGFDETAEPKHKTLRPYSVHLDKNFSQNSSVIIAVSGAGAVDVGAFFKSKGFLVNRIVRIAIGHITLGGLHPGELRLLRDTQVKALLNQPELGERELENIKKEAAPSPEERDEDTRDEKKPKIIIKARSVRGRPSDESSSDDFGGDRGEKGGSRIIRRRAPHATKTTKISPVSARRSDSDESPRRSRSVIKPLATPIPPRSGDSDEGFRGPKRGGFRPRGGDGRGFGGGGSRGFGENDRPRGGFGGRSSRSGDSDRPRSFGGRPPRIGDSDRPRSFSSRPPRAGDSERPRGGFGGRPQRADGKRSGPPSRGGRPGFRGRKSF